MKVSNEELRDYYYVGLFPSDGYTLARKEKGGQWCFIDDNGNLSEEFYWARDYYNGFAVVQKEENGPYRFRDVKGHLSEEKFNQPIDMPSRREAKETLTFVSPTILKLKEGGSIYDLSPEVILDNLEDIKEFLKTECSRMLESCSNKKDLDSVAQEFTDIVDYMQAVACEEHLKREGKMLDEELKQMKDDLISELF